MQYELRVTSCGVTDVGKVRSRNEDSLLVLDEPLVYCVADGMGGVSGGEVASQKVVECIGGKLGCLRESTPLEEKILGIHQSVVAANDWILGWSDKNGVQGAGTTLVLLVLSKEYPWAVNILHAGDSRAYRYRKGQLRQITSDHSIEEAVGDFSEQPLPSQFRGLITNAVGLKRSLSLELTHADQQAGDIWLLCSDGLSKMLSDSEIASLLSRGEDAGSDVLARRLVNEANSAGGKDNVSVVIVKVLACSTQPSEAVSVPFPGPLPSVPEEDAGSSDTSATATMSMDVETNGSVLVNMETPNSETAFLSKRETPGVMAFVFWFLFGLVGVFILYLLWNLFTKAPEPDAVVEQGAVVEQSRAAIGAAEPEAATSSSRSSLEEIVATAGQSGNWMTAYSELQQGDFPPSNGRKSLETWYSQVWAKANRDPDEAIKSWSGFVAAANAVLRAIERDVLPATASWPKDASRVANEFCRRRYALQQILEKELEDFCLSNGRRLHFMETLSGEHLVTAFQVSGLDGRKKKEFDRLLLDAKYAVEELERWLESRRAFPLTKDQLGALPDSHIQYCNKVDLAVGQLVGVLQKRPELQDAGEFGMQEELERIQADWRSVQDRLENLGSGELSSDGEASIRNYLDGLFRFKTLMEQKRGYLNK